MNILIVTLVVFMLAFAGMSAGILLGRSAIQGSCGGAGNKCGSCRRPCDKKKDDNNDNTIHRN